MPATTAIATASRRVRNGYPATVEGDCQVVSFASNLGWMAIATDSQFVQQLAFGYPSAAAAECAIDRSQFSRETSSQTSASRPRAELDVDELVNRLQRFASGDSIDFADVPINETYLTPFGRRVINACRAVGWGETSSYGQLAKTCRRGGAARAVGSVMAKNRVPLIVPCHRILGAGGKLGGYSAPDGLAMKRRLLTLEGGEF